MYFLWGLLRERPTESISEGEILLLIPSHAPSMESASLYVSRMPLIYMNAINSNHIYQELGVCNAPVSEEIRMFQPDLTYIRKNISYNQIYFTTMNKNIEDKVKAIVMDTLVLVSSEVNLNSSLIDLGADSLDAVELIMKFEEEFNISINEETAEKVTTVRDIINLIENMSSDSEAEPVKRNKSEYRMSQPEIKDTGNNKFSCN